MFRNFGPIVKAGIRSSRFLDSADYLSIQGARKRVTGHEQMNRSEILNAGFLSSETGVLNKLWSKPQPQFRDAESLVNTPTGSWQDIAREGRAHSTIDKDKQHRRQPLMHFAGLCPKLKDTPSKTLAAAKKRARCRRQPSTRPSYAASSVFIFDRLWSDSP